LVNDPGEKAKVSLIRKLKQHIMNKHAKETSDDAGTLIDHGLELVSNVRQKAAAGLKASHKAVQTHPYHAVGVALGLGVLLGFLISRRSPKD
jgi:ElaB/YqjD/DUF883 family membrane-anchored ribosome-binding protein